MRMSLSCLRRLLFVALLALIAPHLASAAIALAQTNTGGRTLITNLMTKNVVFGSTMTNPSLEVCEVNVEAFTTIPTISSVVSTKNGTMTQDVSVTTGTAANAGDGTAAIFSIQNTQTVADTLTVNLSAAGYGSVTCFEVTGAATSSALDKTVTNFQNISNTAALSLALSGMAANDGIFSTAVGYAGGSPAWTTDTGFSTSGAQTTGFNAYHFGEYKVPYTTGGSLTLTYGASSQPAYAGVAASYKQFGSGPATSPSQFFLWARPAANDEHYARSAYVPELWAIERRRHAS